MHSLQVPYILVYTYTTHTSPLIGQHAAVGYYRILVQPQVFFHLFKKVSKEKRAMLDGSKTQSNGRNTEAALQQDG